VAIVRFGTIDAGVLVHLTGEDVRIPWRNLLVGKARWRGKLLAIPFLFEDERHWGEMRLSAHGFALLRSLPGFPTTLVPSEIPGLPPTAPSDSSEGIGDLLSGSPMG